MKLTPFVWAIILLFTACQPSIQNPIAFDALDSKTTGIEFSNTLKFRTDINILEYLYYYNGGGVAVGDLNNDGLEDIYFTANQGPDRLYLNNGNMSFTDISETAGLIMDNTWSTGVSMDDVNNDGWLDIYVSKVGAFETSGGHNLLYLNNGDATFTEASEALGVAFSGFSTQAAFLDYDRDGDLDLYLLNHAVHSVRSYGKTTKRKEKDPLSGDLLLEDRLNEAAGQFVDVTEAAGIYSSPLGYGLTVRVADINDDGWSDIYVGNDFHENDFIYLNNQDKTFKESIASLVNHTTRFTMGVDIADLNNDGLQDIFSTDMMPNNPDIFLKSGGEDSDKVDRIKKEFGFEPQLARNHLQLNQGAFGFSELALMTETYATDWSWSVLLADFDNDMQQDIFISNGIVKRPNDLDYINYLSNVSFGSYQDNQLEDQQKEVIDQMPTLKIPNVLFKNKGALAFESLEKSTIGRPNFSTGAAYSDFDLDGDLDIIVNNINEKATLYENQTNRGGLRIQLKGTKENPVVKGAKVQLFSKESALMQELQTTKGFQSSSSHYLHFGLPDKTIVDSIRVEWTDGTVQLEPIGQTLSAIAITKKASAQPKRIENKQVADYELKVLPVRHEENYYLDYEREQLMPEKLSSEGPATVVADFNNDGRNDFFIGGARYRPSQIWIAESDGSYRSNDIPDFKTDEVFEDVDAATLDVDQDGDLDLYVVSGGNDLEQFDKNMIDRIYLNDGQGVFSRAMISLPQTNGSTIAVGDFDNDGYDDFFVGSRSIPSAYGLSPDSYIIQNKKGRGLEILATLPIGMVTDSAWKDINNDGLLDLILVGDWMPITVLLNQDGKNFINATKSLGLDNTEGLWNVVDFSDVDGDGTLDIIAGNTGLNFKWKASVEKPVWLYLDDFDENEQLDPIIFFDFFGEYVPFNSKDKLGQQLPYLKKRFPQYKDFSKVRSIEALTGKKENELLATKKITELRSMIYLQKETGFKAVPLPKVAQRSSIEDFYIDPETQAISFVGNYKDYVVELGVSTGNPGGKLERFNSKTQTFEQYNSFGLPSHNAYRAIQPLTKNEYLILTNDEYAYILKDTSN